MIPKHIDTRPLYDKNNWTYQEFVLFHNGCYATERVIGNHPVFGSKAEAVRYDKDEILQELSVGIWPVGTIIVPVDP